MQANEEAGTESHPFVGVLESSLPAGTSPGDKVAPDVVTAGTNSKGNEADHKDKDPTAKAPLKKPEGGGEAGPREPASVTKHADAGRSEPAATHADPDRLQRTASSGQDRPPPPPLARGDSARRLSAAAASGARLAAATAPASGRALSARQVRAGSMADALNARFLTTVR